MFEDSDEIFSKLLMTTVPLGVGLRLVIRLQMVTATEPMSRA